jgi:hypothetical protein
MVTDAPPHVLAFYLPQFHPIPENDEWWGPGFTEWTNVARARKLYPGHDQPKIPGELGFYDLRLPESREAQAELAREYGVTAFLYWHYWFGDGVRILERPFAEVLSSGRPDFPFCLAWANQTWSGIWHGAADRVLREQRYPGVDDYRAHFESVLPAFRDERYVRVEGRPFFHVAWPGMLPDAQEFVDLWRTLAEEAGLPGLYLVAGGNPDALSTSASFDAFFASRHGPSIEIPRRDVVRRAARLLGVPPVYSYREFSHRCPSVFPDVRSFPVVLSGWDNTPRCGARGVVLHGADPAGFREQVERAVRCVEPYPPEERFIGLKSWNEWAEGNYIEPDRKFGRAFLEALRDGLDAGTRSAAAAAGSVVVPPEPSA